MIDKCEHDKLLNNGIYSCPNCWANAISMLEENKKHIETKFSALQRENEELKEERSRQLRRKEEINMVIEKSCQPGAFDPEQSDAPLCAADYDDPIAHLVADRMVSLANDFKIKSRDDKRYVERITQENEELKTEQLIIMTKDHDRISALVKQNDELAAACAAKDEALRQASHELTTHHGLMATDQDPEKVVPSHLFVLNSKDIIDQCEATLKAPTAAVFDFLERHDAEVEARVWHKAADITPDSYDHLKANFEAKAAELERK